MTWIAKIRKKLAGYKAYLVAIAGLLSAVGAWAGGAISTTALAVAIVAAVEAICLRAGMKKAEAPSGS